VSLKNLTGQGIGVRRNPQNPNRKQKIFGFNTIIETSIELTLGIELPVACTTIAGNASEDLSAPALRQRGYDRNGWPYAPCGILTRPNGFDFKSHRASFSCRRQCVSSKNPKLLEYATNCPFWINYHGFTKHVSISKLPRLITEVIRGTYRYQKLKALRPASERMNSTAKEDFCILARPKIRGIHRAGILAQMAVMVILIKRIARFIVKVTLRFMSLTHNNKSLPPFIPGPKVPRFILNLIQRE